MKKKTFLFMTALWTISMAFYPFNLPAQGTPAKPAESGTLSLDAPEKSTPGKEMAEPSADEPLFDDKEAGEFYNQGLKWYQKRDYQHAVSELEKAVEIKPDFKEAYYLLGYAYYKAGKMDLARDAFNQVYELDRQYAPHLPAK
jgi:tetratricopeptide (TPR) repeat protein